MAGDRHHSKVNGITKVKYPSVIVEIDECVEGQHKCTMKEVCRNTNRSFDCTTVPAGKMDALIIKI